MMGNTVIDTSTGPERARRQASGGSNAATDPLVQIRGLTVGYTVEGRRIEIVRGIDLTIERGRVLGLVGESGSGKTQTARAILRLNNKPLRPLSGQIMMDGMDLLSLPEARLRTIRGKRVAMIFQDPRSALNPLMRVGDQIARVYALHQGITRRDAFREAVEMLRRAGIMGPERVAHSYPHQLSGGMCQRVAIALALGIRPALLIADEPTTGLDVTIQAQILDLISGVQAETGTAVLLITHDLGVVAETCHQVAVMYGGRIVELSGVHDLFAAPRHPYTARLLSSTLGAQGMARPDSATDDAPESADIRVDGQVYRAALPHDGLASDAPVMIEVAPGHFVACEAESEQHERLRAARSG
jgi:peptide/nickel transport system ATP-binding protein